MKRGLTAMFALIFLMSFVFAADCADDQLIMRLSSATNAHASTWNGSTYSEKICYDDLFGGVYDIREEQSPVIDNIHECTRLNQMLFLNNINNSHASTVWDYDLYNEAVCYGDVQCFFDESEGDDCSNGLLAARMYRKENSHMEAGSEENYNVKVCCTDTYMTNTDYKIINQTYTGNTVYFVSPPGFENIKIERDGLLWNPDLENLNSYYDPDLMANIISWNVPKDIITGQITDLIITITGPNGEKTGTSKFNIKVNNSDRNEDMSVGIIGIECADNFTVGESIPIIATASDPDDILEGMIYINDIPQEGSEFTNGGTTIMYDANSAGEVKIEVNATNERGLSSSYIANVMVIDYSKDGNYTAACIAKPANFQDFKDTLVDFDASTSRGIIVENGIAHELIPGNDPFIFNWVFEGGTPISGGSLTEVLETDIATEDYWNTKYFLFQLKYPGAGVKKANLKVELPSVAWDYI